jgi:hypothetical protein
LRREKKMPAEGNLREESLLQVYQKIAFKLIHTYGKDEISPAVRNQILALPLESIDRLVMLLIDRDVTDGSGKQSEKAVEEIIKNVRPKNEHPLKIAYALF